MVDRSKRVELVEAGNNVMVLNDSQATDPERECSVAARDCQLETGSLNVAVGQPQTLTYLSQAKTGTHLGLRIERCTRAQIPPTLPQKNTLRCPTSHRSSAARPT